MNWFLFQCYKLGWQWPYLRWRIYRYGVEDRRLLLRMYADKTLFKVIQ